MPQGGGQGKRVEGKNIRKVGSMEGANSHQFKELKDEGVGLGDLVIGYRFNSRGGGTRGKYGQRM